MSFLPEQEQQIRQTHARLIHQVVQACQNAEARSQLEPMLKEAANSGWQQLVEVIRRILNGERDDNLLLGLDQEDTVIIRSILQGLQDPATLPDPAQSIDGSMAAPALASMIHAASHGDVRALQILADMSEQMTRVGGDMGKLGGIMRKLLDGERDPDELGKGMDKMGQQLVLNLLEEINKLNQ
ncbi:MAG: hypothetical protein PVG89_13680 [Gammaproteobacteria bacterium]|jgi:hypothetical protein